jgi:hypothetical protein
MTPTHYRAYYLDLILGTLGGNRAHFAIADEAGEAVVRSARYRSGLVVLALVSLVEANFLSKGDLKTIRNFGAPHSLPPSVDPTHLACYAYVRDCFAHNPEAHLLPEGNNTTGFLSAVQSGRFLFASLSGTQVVVNDTHPLHLIVLRFFGEPV